MDFKKIFPKNLYHAYVIEGNPNALPYSLRDFLINSGYAQKNSIDMFIEVYDSFNIEDSSRIKSWHAELPALGGKKFCIIGAKFINHDAERTLLKIIEEPGQETHFFIIVPKVNALLDTILSRVQVVKSETQVGNDLDKKINEFIKSKKEKRIDLISDMIKTHSEDEDSGGLRHEAIEWLNALERAVYKKWQADKENTDTQFALEEISSNRNYLRNPGSSVKMILEHISLVL